MVAPIVIFAYDRVNHLRHTVESLKNNHLSDSSRLIVFSDGAQSENKEKKVDEVRSYLATVTGFHSISIHHRSCNYGLAKSIIEGVTEVLSESDRIIVLEDDMVTSPYFLKYMNEALDRYAADDRVISIHGWCIPTKAKLPEAFFLLGADCWGWATWRRGWNLFNPNGRELLDEINRRSLRKDFDLNYSYPYVKMLEDQIAGANNSWAIRWYASAFLAGKLTLHPGRSMVQNIGHDNSGTHCSKSNKCDVRLSDTPIDLRHVRVGLSVEGRVALENYYLSIRDSMVSKFVRYIKSFIFVD